MGKITWRNSDDPNSPAIPIGEGKIDPGGVIQDGRGLPLMFTGIVQEVGVLKDRSSAGPALRFRIHGPRVAAGTRANPLEIVSLSKHLLFFDGSDEQQVAQARTLIARYDGRVKPILVAGSYLALMQRWRTPVYYDQQGALTRKLGITQVPALVSQQGTQLRIDELAP